VTAAKRAAEQEAGLRGNHNRWHVKRKINDPDCEYCYRVPDQVPDGAPESGASRVLGESAPIPPVPVPDPLTTSPNGDVGPPEPRADVLRVCEYLADAIAENGSKRPAITKGWHDEARKMLDIDKRTEAEVLRAIDWCQRGESEKAMFWRPNVMSMTKLRSKFDQMRLQAANENRRAPEVGRVGQHMALVRQLEEAEQQGRPTGLREIGGAS
jgi:hypothetical protein